MMESTGIIQRFDDLGRVVISREIRRQLEIKGEQPMEICIDSGGWIVLKKYNPGERHYGK